MIDTETITHTAKMWRWTSPNGPAAWHFITVDAEAGEALTTTALMRKLEEGRRRGFGSLRVTVRIGQTEWRTSCFPSKETGWMLPVKKAVRVAENLADGDLVQVELSPN